MSEIKYLLSDKPALWCKTIIKMEHYKHNGVQ